MIESKEFIRQRVVLDQSYGGCSFIECLMVFTGNLAEIPVTLKQNEFHQCRWTFEGPALDTLDFLRTMYADGGESLVNEVFNYIKGK